MNQKQTYAFSFAVVTGLFFMWGFGTVMNDVLIPYLKGVFVLNNFQSMLVQTAFFGAYFIGSVIYFFISVKFGDPINHIGYKNGIIAGLLISALGCLLFYPAADLVSYGFFLTALFVLGLGFTVLQIAANPYVSILGPEEGASSRLNLAQGVNSIGTTLSPFIGGYFIFRVFGGIEASGADAVKIPYLFLAGLFIALTVLIKFAHLPKFTSEYKPQKGFGALKFKHLNLGIFAIFAYVGSEVTIGSIMILFLGLEEIAGLSESAASGYVSFYWGGLMIGRFLGSISLSSMRKNLKLPLMIAIPVAAFVSILMLKGTTVALTYGIFLLVSMGGFYLGRSLPGKTLFLFSGISITLLLITMFTQGHIAMWSLVGIGLFNSIMWSNIFTLAIKGLGRHTSQASSLLVMAIVGGAVFPAIQGAVADATSIQTSFIVPLIGYLYIAFYGIHGSKVRSRAKE
jgi:FHS family L-fucose permease-like MFS transporter